jgi:ADP-heptose:LPS heptosyltransferase
VGSVLEDLPRDGRVAVIRLRSLGDCVLTTPALEILKRFRPDLRVSVMVEDRFRELFEGNPDIDEILPPQLSRLRRARPHLCLNLHGGTRSVWMTACSGARYRAGFGHFRGQFVYNVRIPRAQEILKVDRKVHTAEHLASALFYLGAPIAEIPRAKLVAAARPDPCVVIHPIAATPAKTWRAEGFLEAARHLKSSGSDVIFIGGPTDDLSPFRAFRTLAGAPLAEIKSLLASASVFLGNDSGPAHMAAAFGIPSVVLFASSDPAIWGPWRTPSEVIAAPAGIARIRVEQVLEALTRLRVHA